MPCFPLEILYWDWHSLLKLQCHSTNNFPLIWSLENQDQKTGWPTDWHLTFCSENKEREKEERGWGKGPNSGFSCKAKAVTDIWESPVFSLQAWWKPLASFPLQLPM